jgi:hypothetical protein
MKLLAIYFFLNIVIFVVHPGGKGQNGDPDRMSYSRERSYESRERSYDERDKQYPFLCNIIPFCSFLFKCLFFKKYFNDMAILD